MTTETATKTFEPDVEYVIRSRRWGYNGVTERFRFANGQAVAPHMRPDASSEQIASRSERLHRLLKVDTSELNDDGTPRGTFQTYAIYARGEEPHPTQEPMWSKQEAPEGALLDDSGEVGDGQWLPTEKRPSPATKLKPDGSAGYSEKTSEPGDTGEGAPQPVQTPAPAPEPALDDDLPHGAPEAPWEAID